MLKFPAQKNWERTTHWAPDRRTLFMFFETFFWFVCLVTCLLVCLFVCLFVWHAFFSLRNAVCIWTPSSQAVKLQDLGQLLALPSGASAGLRTVSQKVQTRSLECRRADQSLPVELAERGSRWSWWLTTIWPTQLLRTWDWKRSANPVGPRNANCTCLLACSLHWCLEDHHDYGWLVEVFYFAKM